jgi:hypothetical protein
VRPLLSRPVPEYRVPDSGDSGSARLLECLCNKHASPCNEQDLHSRDQRIEHRTQAPTTHRRREDSGPGNAIENENTHASRGWLGWGRLRYSPPCAAPAAETGRLSNEARRDCGFQENTHWRGARVRAPRAPRPVPPCGPRGFGTVCVVSCRTRMPPATNRLTYRTGRTQCFSALVWPLSALPPAARGGSCRKQIFGAIEGW